TAAADAAAAPEPTRGKGHDTRVGVFIDVQNVYYGARQFKGKLDFDALLQAAVRDRRLIHATAYVVESKEIDQAGFIALLQQRAIEVRRKTLQVRADGSMKGDWDMEMALDILDGAPKLDVVVLVSGDGDFTSLVRRVKRMGPRVEVIAFPRNTAKSLLEAADRFQPLDRKFVIVTPPKPAPPRTRLVASEAEPETLSAAAPEDRRTRVR
ncbi:MAG TPA: NYN domain-containing protein, partial [Candidatus Polarisedimenticolaceae bacterium]|nr:NYN domain-containing protein [Candidatus Polarisedimenticolaceae bacterium]